MTASTYVKLDSRKRLLLGEKATSDEYLVTEGENGRIILDPAVVMTRVERNFLMNHEARESVDRALAEPDDVVRGPRKRPEA